LDYQLSINSIFQAPKLHRERRFIFKMKTPTIYKLIFDAPGNRTLNLAEGSLTLVGIQIHVVEKGFVTKRLLMEFWLGYYFTYY